MRGAATKTLRIGVVAGEPSGDLLAAGLIQALRQKHPDLIVEGVAGPAMQQVGCKALFPMEKLAVMGLVEPLFHLREILGIRAKLKKYFLKNPPDIFIGVDAPDFNLNLESCLKHAGIPTMHYVSPTIWAWRPKRVFKIKQAADLVLCLFPFEPALYQAHGIKAEFVGHPMADEIPMQPDQLAARKKFGLTSEDKVLALLPGSRKSELKNLSDVLLKAARNCERHLPSLKILVPMVNQARRQQFEAILRAATKDVYPKANLQIVDGQAREVMMAADVVLLASGTATLEAMLLKKPMVVTYKVSTLNYWVAKRVIRTPYFSFPNILNQRLIVPELIQDAANVENISAAVLEKFSVDQTELVSNFKQWHEKMCLNADEKAAAAVLGRIEVS